MPYDILDEELPGYDILPDEPVAPAAPIQSTPRSLSRFSERFARGSESERLNLRAVEAAAGRVPWKEVSAERKALEKRVQETPAKGDNWFSEALLQSAEMAPPMMSGTREGLKGALIGGGAATIAGPGSPVTVPVAASAGGMMTSANYWFNQGKGALYAELRDSGINHDVANKVSSVAALPYALIEFSQVSKLIPGLKPMAKKALSAGVKRALFEGAKRYGKDWAGEVAEEVAQEVSQAAGVHVAVALDEAVDKADLPPQQLDVAKRAWETAKQSAAPMAALLLPAGTVRTIQGYKPQTPPPSGPAVKGFDVIPETPEQAAELEKLRQTIEQGSKDYAKRIQSDQEQPPSPRQVPQGGQTDRGSDVQQAPPGQPEPVAPRKEEEKAPTEPVLTTPSVTLDPASGTPTPPTSTIVDPRYKPVVPVDPKKLKKSLDVPQFKGEADPETGETERLTGEWDPVAGGTIQLWERLNGDLEVISGRHRWWLAKRNDIPLINAQIFREADGFTKEMAMVLDAELNIKDEKGAVKDYANYFRSYRNITEAIARKRSLLDRAKGIAGFAIGRNASDDLYALYYGGKLDEKQTVAIANAAPGNADLQRVGIRAALDGVSNGEALRGRIEAAANASTGAAQQTDFFSNTELDTVWQKQGDYVAKKRKELNDVISTRRSVVNRYDVATATGSITADLEKAQAELEAAQTGLARWDEWWKHPDLKAEVEGANVPYGTLPLTKGTEAATTKPPATVPKAETTLELSPPESVEQQKARLEGEQAKSKTQKDKEAMLERASATLTGSTGDLGQGDLLGAPTDLFAPKPQSAISGGQSDPTGGESLNLGAQSISGAPSTSTSAPGQPPVTPTVGGLLSALTTDEQSELAVLEAELKKKLGNVNIGVDPTLITTGGKIAILYAKAGYRTFKAFADVMLAKMGEAGRQYLLTWYNNARLAVGPEGFDDAPSAQATFDSDYAPRGRRTVPVPAPASGGRRIAIAQVVRKELIPEPRAYVRDDQYAAKSGFVLSDDQTLGANQALTHFFDRNGPAFLLGDGPGFGKTAQLLVIIDQFFKRNPAAKILYVTQNEAMMKGTIADDSEAMGIDLSRVEMATYHGIKKLIKKDNPLRDQKWDLVVFDEAHNLKNGQSQKSMSAAVLNVSHTIFATATPMDRPTGAAYFLAAITGKTEAQVAEELGYTFQTYIEPHSQKEITYAVLLPKTTWSKVWANIIAFRDAAVGAGAMLRRAYPFYGDVGTVNISQDFTARMEHERLVKVYDDWAERVARFPLKLRVALGQKTLAIRRWSEQHKVKPSFDRAMQWMKDNPGGQVIIMAETAGEQSFRAEVTGGVIGENDAGFTVWRVPGAIQKLTDMFTEAGISIAHIHSPSHQKVHAEVDKFQAGKAPVALATPGSGGTGINLDDTVGNRPRLMIMLSKHLAGDMWDQIIGRISRKNTQSPSKVELFHMPDSYGDQRAEDISDKKVRTLRAIQGGHDADQGLDIDESGNRTLALEDWDVVPGESQQRDTRYDDVLLESETVGPVLEAIAERSENSEYRALASGLISKGISSKLEVVSFERPTRQGFYDRPTDTVQLSENAVDVEKAILHEVLHAVTVGPAMRDPVFRQSIVELLEAARAQAKVHYYGLTNEFELVAEAYSNPDFQTFLKGINRGTIWQRFLNMVRSWLGIEQRDLSLLNQVFSVVDPQMESPTQGEGMFALEDESGVVTEVMGVEDIVSHRDQLTPAALEASHVHAKGVFDASGVPVEFDVVEKYWVVTGGTTLAGRRLTQLLKEELANRDGKPDMASLASSIVFNFKFGKFAPWGEPVANELYSYAQGERSHRGFALGILAQIGAGLEFIGQNVKVALHRERSLKYGGESIERFVNAIRKHFSAFFKDQTILGALEADPELKQAFDDLKITAEGKRLMPSLSELVRIVLDIPFFKHDDIFENFRNLLIEHGAKKENAERVTGLLERAWRDRMKTAAKKAFIQAEAGLTPSDRIKLRELKTLYKKIEESVNAGVLDTGDVLIRIAKARGWNPPTEAEVKQMKDLTEKVMRLKNLSEEEMAEIKAFEPADLKAELEVNRSDKEALNEQEINRTKRQIQLMWSRMTKPVSWMHLNSTKANIAEGTNEWMAANILLKIGFAFFRLPIAVLTQGGLHGHFRAAAQAMKLYQDSKGKPEAPALLKEVWTAYRDAIVSYWNSFKPALYEARASLLGRGEIRNVEGLISSVNSVERINAQAKEQWQKGNYPGSIALYTVGLVQWSYRVAAALDSFQGVAAENQELRYLVKRHLRNSGMTAAQAEMEIPRLIGDMKKEALTAIEEVKAWFADQDRKPRKGEIKEVSWRLARRRAFNRIKGAGLPADDFEAQIRLLRSTLSWNEPEQKGIGGGVAMVGKAVGGALAERGVPTAFTRFSNAIGISINRQLAFTPFWRLALTGKKASGWAATDTDLAQRRVESLVGYMVGGTLAWMVYAGLLVVRAGRPKDKEEREVFDAEGHIPYSVEIPTEGGFYAVSLNNSPFQIVAPYMVAAAKLREIMDNREKQQQRLNEEAAKKGLVPEQLPPLAIGDLLLAGVEAAKQSIFGTRTAAGAISSMTYFGMPNSSKFVAGQLSPLVPGLPAYQELTRMAGIHMDSKLAGIVDFMVPMPGSPARAVNMLGDPIGTPDDFQRISQIMTGGTYPGIVRSESAREDQSYRNLLASAYRPPSINPGRGYSIGTDYRVFTEGELGRYTQLRGQYLKEELSGFDSEDPKLSKAAYSRANARALSEMGVTVAAPKRRSRKRTSTRRRPRRLSSLRAPRLGVRSTRLSRRRSRRRLSRF